MTDNSERDSRPEDESRIAARLSIAVVIPTYNRARFVGEAIDSVLAQTDPVDEIIVVDDGSTDETPAVLAAYGSRITVLRQANAGASAARNAGAAHATATWLTFLDSDDLWHPERIALLRRDLAEKGDAAVAAHVANVRLTGHGSETDFFRVARIAIAPGTVQRVERPLRLFLHAFFLVGAALPRELFAALGGFDTSFKVDEDSELAHRLAETGPFLVRGDVVGDIIRRGTDAAALSMLRGKDPWMTNDLKLRQFRGILARTRNPEDAEIARRSLSHALLQRAALIRHDGRSGYAGMLLEAARSHPSPLKGYGLALLALLRNHREPKRSGADRTRIQPQSGN